MADWKHVATGLATGLVAVSACQEAADDTIRPGISLFDQDTENIIGSSDIQSINGTYTDCTNRTGSWSLAVTGSPTLDNPALSVLQGDGDCSLAITEIRTGTDGLLSASAPLLITATFGPARSFGTPISFYANAILGAVDFTANFTLTLLFSADPRTATGTATATFATVNASSASAMGVLAPNYTLNVAGALVTTDIAGVTSSVLGNVVLTPGSATGDFYLIVNGTVADTYAAINTTYTGGSPVVMATTIAASSFLAPGVDITGGTVRTLIIAKVTNGVASYQKFAITFNPPA